MGGQDIKDRRHSGYDRSCRHPCRAWCGVPVCGWHTPIGPPDLTNFDNIVLAASIFLFYAGMELSGVHVREIRNPTVNYPKAVFLGALITVAIFIFGTYALGLIIPAKDINLVQSLLVGFDNYFRYFHIGWLSPVIAVALVFGVLAGVLTWWKSRG